MVDNTEIWTGANTHLTFVPESDLFLGFAGDTDALATANSAESSGTYTGLYKLENTLAVLPKVAPVHGGPGGVAVSPKISQLKA